MTIERMHSNERMSKIVIFNNVVYLCGQVGAGDNITVQTIDMLSRVDTLLTEAGTDKSKILQAIILVSDMKNFSEMNAVWDAWVPDGHPPVRACGEAKLATDSLLVEVIITAAVD